VLPKKSREFNAKVKEHLIHFFSFKCGQTQDKAIVEEDPLLGSQQLQRIYNESFLLNFM